MTSKQHLASVVYHDVMEICLYHCAAEFSHLIGRILLINFQV